VRIWRGCGCGCVACGGGCGSCWLWTLLGWVRVC
jgi:hypothetical protein